MRVIKLQNNTEHIINMHIKKRNDDIADITEIIFHEEGYLPILTDKSIVIVVHQGNKLTLREDIIFTPI